MAINVILADDHAIIRHGLRALLESASEIRVVGEAGDGREAVQLALKMKPDVVVMDVFMPNLNGIEASRLIRRRRPEIKIVVVSASEERQYVIEALRAGVSAYLFKNAAPDELVSAVQQAAAGHTYLSKELSTLLRDDAFRQAGDESSSGGLECLSLREREILQLVTEGHSSEEIAHALHLSVHTVNTHRRNIMEKLNVHNVAELVKFTLRHGLASPV